MNPLRVVGLMSAMFAALSEPILQVNGPGVPLDAQTHTWNPSVWPGMSLN